MKQQHTPLCAMLAVLLASWCMTDSAIAQPIKVAFSREITIFNDDDPDALNFPTRQVSYWNDLGITIDFEGLNVGDAVSNQYENLGVVFTTTSGSPIVTDNVTQPDFVPSSGTQLLGDPTTPPLTPTVIELTFVTQEDGVPSATTSFGCTVISANGPGHTVAFFAPDDTQLHLEDVSGSTGPEVVLYTPPSSGPPIARVVITLGDGTDSAAIDEVFFKQPIEALTPDVQGLALTAPLGALAGSTVLVDITVANNGFDTAQPTWMDRLYRSTDPIWDNGDPLVAPFTASTAVAPGGTYSRQHNFMVPSSPGQYYLILRVDDDDDLEEGYGESNNTIVSAPINVQAGAQADLQVSAVDSIGTVVSGQTIAVTYTVTNASTNNGPTSGSWVDSVFLTQQPLPTMPGESLGLEILLGQFGNPSFLAPGENYENTVNVLLPEDLDGCYHVVVYTDNRKADENAFVTGGSYDILESNEDNNHLASALFEVTLAPQPDLVVEPNSVTFSTTIQSWNVFSVTWTVTNQGDAATQTGSWIDRVYLSTNDQPSTAGDFELGSLPRNGLPLGGMTPDASRTLNRLLPATLNGTFYVKIHVDADDEVSEIGLEDNVFVCTDDLACPLGVVTVVPGPLPDLQNPANTTLVGQMAIAGASTTVTWSGANVGADPAEAVTWQDAVYLSDDMSFEPTDLLLGTRTVHSTPDGMGGHTINYTTSKSVVIPTGTTPGTYYIFVRLDDQFELAPSHLENVTPIPAQVNVISSPVNLVISADPASLDPAAAGEVTTLTWRVQNSGTGPTPASTWRDRVYLSADTTIDPQDRVLSTQTHSTLLSAGGPPSEKTVSVTVPALTPGAYHLIFRTDLDSAIPETDESDNITSVDFCIASESADLVPLLTVNSTTGTAGFPVTVDWTVTNTSDTHTTLTPRWIDRIYLSTAPQLDGSETVLVGRRHTGVLGPLADYSQSAQVTLPLDAAGAYHLILQADADNNVFEPGANGNNTASVPITINPVPLPDLVVTQTDGADTAVSGQEITVTWTVQNQGTGATLVDEWGDNVYLSPDPFLDPGADVFLGTVVRSSVLAAGATYSVNASLPIPPGTAGDHFVFVDTDSANDVFETNDSNNSRLDPIVTTVSFPDPADLQVDSMIQFLTPAAIGDSILVQWSVTNHSATTTVVGAWTDGIYLSPDPVWDVSDVLIGEHTASETVAPGAPTGRSTSVVLPPILPGPYYVIVRTDLDNQIVETDEDNNATASASTLDVAAIQLQLPGSDTSTLTSGEELLYEVPTVGGETVRIQLSHDGHDASTELFASEGTLPTPSLFEQGFDRPGEANQTLILPTRAAGSTLVLVRGIDVPGQDSFTITTESLPLQVLGVRPSVIGDFGRVTLTVQGARFEAISEVSLRRAGEPTLHPLWTEFIDSTTVRAQFDLLYPTHGSYDVIVNNGLEETAPEKSVQVTTRVDPQLLLEVDPTEPFRAGNVGSYRSRVSNAGNVDAPFVVLSHRIPREHLLDLENGSSTSEFTFDWESASAFIHTSVDKYLPPGEFTELTSRLSTSVTTGLIEVQRGAAVLETPGMAALQDTAAADLRTYLLDIADPAGLPAGLLVDAGAELQGMNWPGYWFQRLQLAGILDATPGTGTPPLPATSTSCPTDYGLGTSTFTTLDAYYANGAENTFLDDPPGEFYVLLEAQVSDFWQLSECESVELRAPFDPNEKNNPGSDSPDTEAYVGVQKKVPYTIQFENTATLAEGGAPASFVLIEDELSSEYRVSSFELGNIGIGDMLIEVPQRRTFYQTTVSVEAQGVLVQITAGIDAIQRRAFWTFQSLDPATMAPPQSAAVGFLPPQSGTIANTGFVQLHVAVSPGVSANSVVTNRAAIHFDNNAPILTGFASNPVDPNAPVSQITSATLQSGFMAGPPVIDIAWGLAQPDTESGLQSFTLYGRVDDGEAFPILQDTTETTHAFEAETGRTYRFYTRATDWAGNVEPPTLPGNQTMVTVAGVVPTIASISPGETVCPGEDVVFSVEAEGSSPLFYQWFDDGSEINGETSSSLTLSMVDADDAGDYFVRVVNVYGTAFSMPITLSVTELPAIDLPDSTGAYCPGTAISLIADVTGDAVALQWFKDDQPLAGETTDTLIIASIGEADVGVYRLTGTNACSEATSRSVRLGLLEPVTIVQPPTSTTACFGHDAHFEVGASGSGTLQYRWFHNGTELPAETGPGLSLHRVGNAQSGSYTVEVSNICGVETVSATLTVFPTPRFKASPMDKTQCVGETASFAIELPGGPRPGIQWFHAGAPLAGETGTSLIIPSVTLADAGVYSVRLSNACGTIQRSATLTVQEPPAVTSHPMPQSICLGSSTTLTVATTGAAPLRFQWFHNGLPIAGAEDRSYTVTDASTTDTGDYFCRVTNNCATSADSTVANVEVLVPPEIVSAPAPREACLGQRVAFQVEATGSEPLQYQWRHNGMPLVGEESALLVIDGTTLADTGDYDVIVTNACGTIVSERATLKLLTELSDCDCNSNSEFDDVDIGVGTSLDQNSDGIPDECQVEYVRGDSNNDLFVNTSDVVTLLEFVFGVSSVQCEAACDVNNDDNIDLSDPIELLGYLFAGSPSVVPTPFPGCGLDAIEESLSCADHMCP